MTDNRRCHILAAFGSTGLALALTVLIRFYLTASLLFFYLVILSFALSFLALFPHPVLNRSKEALGIGTTRGRKRVDRKKLPDS